jgi:hypothetical protein
MRTLLAIGVLLLFAGLATTAPVPKALKKQLRAVIEPLPGEELHSVDWHEVPFKEVAEELERLSGMVFLSKDEPKMTVTLRAKNVCVWELFARLDDLLIEDDWLLIRKRQSFSCYPATERLPQVRAGDDLIELSRLRTQSRYLCRRMTVELSQGVRVEDAQRVAKEVIGDGLEAKAFGARGVMLQGRVMDLRRFVDEMGDRIQK